MTVQCGILVDTTRPSRTSPACCTKRSGRGTQPGNKRCRATIPSQLGSTTTDTTCSEFTHVEELPPQSRGGNVKHAALVCTPQQCSSSLPRVPTHKCHTPGGKHQYHVLSRRHQQYVRPWSVVSCIQSERLLDGLSQASASCGAGNVHRFPARTSEESVTELTVLHCASSCIVSGTGKIMMMMMQGTALSSENSLRISSSSCGAEDWKVNALHGILHRSRRYRR